MESDPESRAIRALRMQARVHPASSIADHRALVSSASNWRKTKEICPWCNEPNSEPNSAWHPQCQKYYYIARGATHYEEDSKSTPLIPKTPCVKCADSPAIIDHIIPLEVASKSKNTIGLKPWTPSNLQWLCATCHDAKPKWRPDKTKGCTPNTKPTQLSLL